MGIKSWDYKSAILALKSVSRRKGKRMKRILQVFIICLSVWPMAIWAQTVVLIHGFQSQGMDWRVTGVTAALQSSGWVDAGHLRWQPQAMQHSRRLNYRPPNALFTVDLPSSQSVVKQAQVLEHYLRWIYAQRGEALTLVGHSAGGVVARYWLVQASRRLPVDTFITIASPNLGTPLANLTQAFEDTALMEMAQQMGFGQFIASRALYTELREEQAGNFMHWLNHQAHPAVRYVALVRVAQQPEQVDFVVPYFSQNLNNVAALREQAEIWHTPAGHLLEAGDGHLIARILAGERPR